METKKTRIATYREFWPFYLSQHSRRWTMRIHAIGLVAAFALVALAIHYGYGWWSWLLLLTAYGPAWFSHFVIEKNRPATFEYPWWSLISEYRMVALLLLRKL